MSTHIGRVYGKGTAFPPKTEGECRSSRPHNFTTDYSAFHLSFLAEVFYSCILAYYFPKKWFNYIDQHTDVIRVAYTVHCRQNIIRLLRYAATVNKAAVEST